MFNRKRGTNRRDSMERPQKDVAGSVSSLVKEDGKRSTSSRENSSEIFEKALIRRESQAKTFLHAERDWTMSSIAPDFDFASRLVRSSNTGI